MSLNNYVFTATWNEHVHRWVAFYGEGSDAWKSPTLKPSCSVIPVRGNGPNNPDVVYAGSFDGWVYALDFNNGTVLSKTALVVPPMLGVTPIVRGIAYANGVVYCTAGDGLYAVNPSLGPLWKVEMGDLAWGTPVVENDIVYACSLHGKLYAISAADGSTAWVSEAALFFASSPVVADGVVYADAGDSLLALNASDGMVLWQSKSIDGSYFLSPVAVGGGVVFASTWGNPNCYAFKVADGASLWAAHLPSYPQAPAFYKGALLITAGKAPTLTSICTS